jgi:hypothetical protein
MFARCYDSGDFWEIWKPQMLNLQFFDLQFLHLEFFSFLEPKLGV